MCACAVKTAHIHQNHGGFNLYNSLMTEFSWKRDINLLRCLNTCNSMHLIHAADSCGQQEISSTVYRFAMPFVSHSQDRT